MSFKFNTKALRYMGYILFIYLFLYIFDNFNSHYSSSHTLCLFKNITGIPCAGCGLSRSTLAFLSGDFATACAYHILGIPLNLFFIVSFVWLAYDTFTARDTFFSFFNSRIGIKTYMFFIFITLISWGINIYRGV